MADQTDNVIGDILKGWKKISPGEVSGNDELYLIRKARSEGIEIREATLKIIQPRRFEPPSMILYCPFCNHYLELRIYCDEFRKCPRCSAFICIRLDIVNQTYTPYAMERLPSGYFSFAGFLFDEARYGYMKEILQAVDNWKHPLDFKRFKEIIRDAEEKLKRELLLLNE